MGILAQDLFRGTQDLLEKTPHDFLSCGVSLI